MELSRIPEGLVCSSGRPYHAKACFKATLHGFCPPFVLQQALKELLTPVLYDQFYCETPLSQKKAHVHRCRNRCVTFYWHCHCSSANSLQCAAAKKVANSVFYHSFIVMQNDNKMCPVPVCCDTWACIPFKPLGIVKQRRCTCYFFVMGGKFETEVLHVASEYSVKFLPFKPNVEIVCVICSCVDSPESCLKRVRRMMNCLRMVMCCSFVNADALQR
ncbi:E4.2 [Snake adenovirus 1]|uniref:Protein E4.2 n=1 Tax=Snake adenovirus serotype 1 TaxID=189830 RepID=E42_ADES1|nr:E4.2 [Snake adenovirus 1]A9CB98.1 RecName: Full=Protein E4.2 [Snake adenovirus 1]ABA47248.1 E4.2 [Snake adenovirus 1]